MFMNLLYKNVFFRKNLHCCILFLLYHLQLLRLVQLFSEESHLYAVFGVLVLSQQNACDGLRVEERETNISHQRPARPVDTESPAAAAAAVESRRERGNSFG